MNMRLLLSSQQKLLVSLLMTLFLLVAQGASIKHDVEHYSHDHQELCSGFIKYQSCHALTAYTTSVFLFHATPVFVNQQAQRFNVYHVERVGLTRAPPVFLS